MEDPEIIKGPQRMATIERTAQQPVEILRDNKERGKTCGDAILFLRQVRNELKELLAKKPGSGIDNPNSDFKTFYSLGDNDMEHHVALFSMLKGAGYSRTDIESFLIDHMPERARGPDPKRPSSGGLDQAAAVHRYLEITQAALNKVFSPVSDAQ